MSLERIKLEDEFAGLAMQTLILKNEDKNKLPITIAREAYKMAGAMMKAKAELDEFRSKENSEYQYRPHD